MSLILGAWMTLLQSYQSIALRLMQQESQRVQLRKVWDDFEIYLATKGAVNESSRMSGGIRPKHAPSQPTPPIKRSFDN